MKNKFFKMNILSLSLLMFLQVYAGQNINLMQQPTGILATLLAKSVNTQLTEISRALDMKKTLHVRIQQKYLGYPVWNANAIVHIPNGEKVGKSFVDVMAATRSSDSFMNGNLYQNLNSDLANTPPFVFEQTQAQKTLEYAIATYQHQIGGKPKIKLQQSNLIVYVDKSQKAHWAYKVSFFAPPIKSGAAPTEPVYIIVQ